jgi:hypothetical protein
MRVDYGREPDYAVLPTKIVGQSNRPRRSETSARRLIWHGTIGSWEEITVWDCWVLRSDGRARELTVTRPSSVSQWDGQVAVTRFVHGFVHKTRRVNGGTA